MTPVIPTDEAGEGNFIVVINKVVHALAASEVDKEN